MEELIENNVFKAFEEFKSIRIQKCKEIIKKENLPKLISDIYKKILEVVFKKLEFQRHHKGNRIFFDIHLWVELHNTELFKKNGIHAHNLTKLLRKNRIITKYSKLYPKNQVLLSVNPLAKSFIYTNIHKIDRVLDIRDKFIDTLLNMELNLEKEESIYIYFRLFTLTHIPLDYYKYIKRKNIFHFDEKILVNIMLEEHNGFIPLKNILFDENESKFLLKIFYNNSENILDKNEYIFSKDFDYYELKLNEFCKNNQLKIKETKRIIQFEYQHNYTPLELYLKTYTKHPKINLLEIDKFYKNTISKKLLEIEKNNLQIYRQSPHYMEDDEIELEDVLGTNFELYDKLKQIKNVPNDKKLQLYLKKWYQFIRVNRTKVKKFESIFNYLEYLLQKADKNISADYILAKTLQSYIQIMFDYSFNIIVKSVNIEDAIISIDDKLRNSNLTPNVIIKYENRIHKYLFEEYNIKLDKINSLVHYNRSIVFEDELNSLVKRLLYRDKTYKCEILKLSRSIYCILAYYSGLRRNELRLRLLNDCYVVDDNKFVIDVNKDGYNLYNKCLDDTGNKLKLKNTNAKRRVEIEILNSKHANLLKNYLKLLENSNYTVMFPDILDSTKKAAKKRFIKNSQLNEINQLLQKVTGRYTVIHSFRHTYITNEIANLLQKKNKSINDIFDLLIKIGHSDFDTTLQHYCHIDLIYLYLSRDF